MHKRTSLWFLVASVAVVSPACGSASGAPTETTGASTSADTLGAPSTGSFGPSARRDGKADRETQTPIKHVIVIIGENRSFDHVYATYKPKHGQSIDNLLSKGIINEDGTPGPNFARVVQKTAVDQTPAPYDLSPPHKKAYTVLPPALAGGPTQPFLSTHADAETAEGAALPTNYVDLLTTGGTGLTSGAVDTRLAQNPTTLPPGPFQLTPGIPYDAYSASPVHRFYQMWQQLDCSLAHVTPENPSGCRSDLFPWVETTIGAGDNGVTQPAGFTDESTHEGSAAMGFYNVLQGTRPTSSCSPTSSR